MGNEEQVVRKIARAMGSSANWGAGAAGRRATAGLLRLGIGDDAAIVAPRAGYEWVLSCDAFLEGVHFLERMHPADSVGYKALARAASDLAAMGATPRLFLLTLALPAEKTGRWLDEFLAGMKRAAGEQGMRLAGGDTTRDRRVAISVTVVGEVRRGRAVKRSGALAGDIIYVSGKLGRAELGLEILRRGLGRIPRLVALERPHLYPTIRIELGRWLAEKRIASAMMDLSDGLSTDLPRLAAASGVGAKIWSERIPCVEVPADLARRLRGPNFRPLQLALHGGDDYELLFTLPREKEKLPRGAPGGVRLTAIGEMTREKGIVLVGARGEERRLESKGWDPFRRG
jgi:thiamine-monophosphate kinase